jgi:hypothetical protein
LGTQILTLDRFGVNVGLMAGLSQAQKNLRAAMKEALRLQDRFVAEPVFGKTGQGCPKSQGVRPSSKLRACPENG